MPRFRFTNPGGKTAGAESAPPSSPMAAPLAEQPARPLVVSGAPMSREDRELIEEVQQRLLSEPELAGGNLAPDHYVQRIASIVNTAIDRSGRIASDRERARIVRLAQSEMLGFGPLEEFLADDTVSEIMVNGPERIWVERAGKLFETDSRFSDEEHARRIIDRILSPLGRRCDESNPMVDARLPDGSRVNVIIPPLALGGSTITIRKFSKRPLTASNLIDRGSATPELIEFLRACVLGRINVVVAGGTGTGKTTMLNVLSSFIPEDERIVTIENAAELQLQQRHVVTLESRPANIEGRGEVSMRDLVVNSLRMRPDRIVVGECRAGETLDMLQAMNTGHDGSMTTLHANSPRDALRRMETMVLMSGMDLPVRAIREQISSAVDLVVQLERMQDGTRRITHVAEIIGMENDVITMSDLFVFNHQGVRDGKVLGAVRPTGLRPRFIERLQHRNINLAPAVFGISAGRVG